MLSDGLAGPLCHRLVPSALSVHCSCFVPCSVPHLFQAELLCGSVILQPGELPDAFPVTLAFCVCLVTCVNVDILLSCLLLQV